MSNGYYHQDERDEALNIGAQLLVAVFIAIIVIVIIVIAQDHNIAAAENALYGESGTTTKWANPGALYDAPFEYDSYIIHDRSNRQYMLVERQDGSWQILQVLDKSVTNVTPNE